MYKTKYNIVHVVSTHIACWYGRKTITCVLQRVGNAYIGCTFRVTYWVHLDEENVLVLSRKDACGGTVVHK